MPEGRTYGGREDILEAADAIYEDVKVPEFGDKWYRIKGLSGAAVERYQTDLGIYSKKGRTYSDAKGVAMARLVSLCVVDEQDRRLFAEDDVRLLGNKSAAGLSRIVDVARRLSGMTDEEMDDLEKNSESDQNGSSTSSSPPLSVAASLSSSDPSPIES